MTASATIYVEEKENALTLTGKAVRFTPDKEYLMKQFEKMRSSGNMPPMPAGAPSPTAGAPSMPTGGANMPTGMPAFGANADPKTKTVWLKDDKMGIRPAIIKIGIDNGNSVEVISGLNEGDEVVISTGDPDAAAASKRTENGPPGFPF
jgi:HlyD family secretion protein